MLNGLASGCPLHNLVPEWNDLIYNGNWEEAYYRLAKTNNFPEFTSRVCPALCENACTCGLHEDPVSTKANEYGIIENAYEKGYAAAKPPKVRTGKKVAVVGSGPSGLAVADQLNRRGHLVTVFERSDRIGGLLMYGIPNMKLEKHIIDRKLKVMEEEGVTFVTNSNIGKDVKAEKLLKEFDRVVLCCGSSNPRDISAPGRRREIRGVTIIIPSDTAPTARVYGSIRLIFAKYTPHFDTKSLGTSVNPSPKKSLICVEKIVSAIPAVKPTTTGYGINFTTVPSRNRPIRINIIPAISVATARPVRPNSVMIPATITMKAPVGPPICTELPPKADTMNPPIIAVISPIVGLTPDAMPKAMANGRATIPTTTPAVRSDLKRPHE